MGGGGCGGRVAYKAPGQAGDEFLKDSDLTRYEADRDLAADVLQAVRGLLLGHVAGLISTPPLSSTNQ